MNVEIIVSASAEYDEVSTRPYAETFDMIAKATKTEFSGYRFDRETKVASTCFKVPPEQVEAFCTLVEWAGDMSTEIVHDPHREAVARVMNHDTFELGDALKRYLIDSDHGGWDGYTASELSAVDEFLTDLFRFIDAETK